MTRQELFDKAYVGLKAQGFVQSRDNTGTCLYRGPKGRKCAIGFAILDNVYIQEMDTRPSEWPLGKVLRAIGMDEVESDFALALRETHDTCDDPTAMKEHLEYFAHEHDLKVPA